jgi:F-type H+-transporting ATPase subunit b
MIDLIHIAEAATSSLAQVAEVVHTTPEGGVLGTLGIDWKLFLAQAINFGVILFVLWRWVLTPVAKRLEDRTRKIEGSLNDARTIEKEKEEFSLWKNKEMTKSRQDASAIIKESQMEAVAVKEALLSKAKEEQEALIKNTQAQLTAEKERTMREIKSEAADLVVASVEKILEQKMDADADQEYVKKVLNL